MAYVSDADADEIPTNTRALTEAYQAALEARKASLNGPGIA
jgi:hypothetical protein